MGKPVIFVSPDEKYAAVVIYGKLDLWDLVERELVAKIERHDINFGKFLSDSKRFVTISQRSVLRMWELKKTGKNYPK